MTDDTGRALRAVLDPAADQDVPSAARAAAERDLAVIRRGLDLLAAQAAPIPTAADRYTASATTSSAATHVHRRPLWRRAPVVAAAGAALAIAAAVGVVALRIDPSGVPDNVIAIPPGVSNTDSPAGPPTGAASAAAQQPPPLGLAQQVAQAERIVVGTIARVDRGVVPIHGGLPYVLATTQVTETIKGTAGDVVALDWDHTGTTGPDGDGRPWRVGDRVLLFLVSDANTLFADVRPDHLRVAGGQRGRFLFDGDRLHGADFTLDQLRRTTRSARTPLDSPATIPPAT